MQTSIVNGIDLAGEGGLVWTKARTSDPNDWITANGYEKGAFRYVLQSNTTKVRFDHGGSILLSV
jgi:hypothetical protein